MRKRVLRSKIWLPLCGVLLLLAVACFLFYKYYDVYFKGCLTFEERERTLYVPRNTSFEELATLLQENGIVEDTRLLRTFAKVKGYDTKNYSGAYRLSRGLSLRDLMLLLVSRQQQPVRLVVPSVRTVEEMAGRLARQLDIDSVELLAYLHDPASAASYDFSLQTFPAMFIPNTYEVYWDISPERLLARLHREYRAFWTPKRLARAEKIGLSPVEVSTLASIIQEEVMHAEELPKIARVYLNRLRINMALQACPTAKFAAGDMSLTRVLYAHTQIASPYNTYQNLGLPPGPIRYPSIAAIDAVLHPADHDYLFFCAKPDFSGYHNFSRTAAQHAQYARQYQRALDRRR